MPSSTILDTGTQDYSHIKKTIPIAFNGGAYGTYLEWCLTTLTTDTGIVSPILEDGSSHGYIGCHLRNMSGWYDYINQPTTHRFVRFHPKVSKEESLTTNLDIVLTTVDKLIYLYPDKNSVLLNINNTFHKVSKSWWPKPCHKEFENDHSRSDYQLIADRIYQNWPVDKDVEFDQIPEWIKREFLSYYLVPMWQDQVEWFHPNHYNNPNCYIVYINELLYDFENTLQKIQESLNIEFKKNIKQLIPAHNIMLSQQINLGQDLVCSQIIDSIATNVYLSWEQLPLPSESWIQWQLRELGYEMYCAELNQFPTDSINLKKLLYEK